MTSAANQHVGEKLAEAEPLVLPRMRLRVGTGPGHLLHPCFDLAAVEQHPVAIDACESQLVEIEDGELEQVPVAVHHLQPVVGLAVRERDLAGAREPRQVAAQLLLGARAGHHEEVVVGPLVGP